MKKVFQNTFWIAKLLKIDGATAILTEGIGGNFIVKLTVLNLLENQLKCHELM